MAEDGLRYAVPDSGGLLAGLAARATARIADGSAARSHLRTSAEALDRTPVDDDVGGVFAFGEARQHYLAGTTHVWLQEPEIAQQEADRAVWLFE